MSLFNLYLSFNFFFCFRKKLPELNDEFEDEKEPFREKIKITLIQIMGLIIGMSIIVLLNVEEAFLEF